MFKKLLLSTLSAVLLFSVAYAQDDSLHYDLGRVLAKKSATQTSSISGSDLEKYQVTNLSDAINVWLNGTYTQSASILYVIDGNIISDVNAYSIFDVEQVTLIQGSVAQAAGAANGQQLVLIKLRTIRKGKSGIEVNGQNSLVNIRNNNNNALQSSGTGSVYDQYYLSGYKNYQQGTIGLTAEYQRDVDPSLNGDGLEFLQAPHFNRFKINAFASANLGKTSTLSFTAGYVPQVANQSYSRDTAAYGSIGNIFNNSHVSQYLFNSTLNLKTEIGKGLTNRLSLAYNHYTYFETDQTQSTIDTNTQVKQPQSNERSHNLLFRDYLYYHKQMDSLEFESTLNMTYRDFEDSIVYNTTRSSYSPNVTPYAYTETLSSRTAYKSFLLTPTVDLFYKDAFNIQGGAIALLNRGAAPSGTTSPGHILPFFNFAFSPARLVGLKAIKWQIYASYARQSQATGDEYSSLTTYSLMIPPGAVPYVFRGYDQNQQYNNYHLGSSVGISRNFSITYTYEYKNFSYFSESRVPLDANGGIGFIPFNGRAVTTRFSLNYNLHSPTLTWNARLTGSETELQVTDNPQLIALYNASYLGQGHRWSGGYTNRFVFKNYFAGIDFLYQLGARPDNLINALATAPDFIAPSDNNSFTIQNVYFGTRIRIPGIKYVDLFANGRNILQNNSSAITDNRRYYGLGFKCGI